MSERPLLPAVEKMLERRRRTGTSQAYPVMHQRGFPVALSPFQKWETGECKSTRITALATTKVLVKHPVVSVVSRPSSTDADE